MPRRRLSSGLRRPIRPTIVKRAGSGSSLSRRRGQTSSRDMSDTIDRPHASVTGGSGAVKSHRFRLDGSRPDEWDGSIPSPDGRASGAASASQNTRQSLKFARPPPSLEPGQIPFAIFKFRTIRRLCSSRRHPLGGRTAEPGEDGTSQLESETQNVRNREFKP